MTDTRRLTAFHEVGHAVAALYWRWPVDRVELPDDHTGRCHIRWGNDPHARACVALAGWMTADRACPGERAAAWKSFGVYPDGRYQLGSDADRACLAVNDDNACLQRANDEVAAMLADPRVWSLVERLADELYTRGTLEVDDLRAIAQSARVNP